MKKLLAAAAMWLLSCAGHIAFPAGPYGIPDDIQQCNILHCFDWTFSQIQAELPAIAEAGFGAVQVSPVQGNCSNNAEWFYAYMPYDFAFRANGSGTRNELRALCSKASEYGISIIVDVVANHVNQASGYHDSWWDSNGRVRWQGRYSEGSRYSITHGQLGDYGDVNSEDTQVQQRALAFVRDLKSLGVKGIRWDAAKHIGLPSENCDFWKTVTSETGIYHYGEILDTPGGDKYGLLREYTGYMTVTDSEYSRWTLDQVCGGNVPSGAASWGANNVRTDKIILWGESHDMYSNDGQYGINSANISQDKIDRAWAICACRKNETSLYFSRPSATTRSAIRMGQKGSTHFKDKEIAAVNHFRNAMAGTDEVYSASGGIATITRKGGGAVIVIGAGGSRSVSVTNGGGYVPAGSYTDEVSGNRFTVTSSTISGNVGPTGIAVIYKAAEVLPSVSFTPDGGTFRTETITVTATAENAASATYSIDGSPAVTFTGSATFTIGEDMEEGESIGISWTAVAADGKTASGKVTFTKKAPAREIMVYYNNPENWNPVNIYMYKGAVNNTWPGERMTYSATAEAAGVTGLWMFTVPEEYADGGRVIFNNGGSRQYPQNVPGEECGFILEGVSMACIGTDWVEAGEPVRTPGWTIHFRNSAGWSNVSAYLYTSAGNHPLTGDWPGKAMVYDTSTAMYSITFDTAEDLSGVNVIFNGSGGQTGDNIRMRRNAIYDISGDTGESGVVEITGDSGDVPEEYYTLQGVRIPVPAAPGIYIRVRGNRAEKVYVK